MRLWSLHPSYLDAVGLVALWREGLLARKVCRGRQKDISIILISSASGRRETPFMSWIST